ncbi:Uncharacterised protein [Shigella sonnei]|nr:Uncharacterised protein [Shigella sonnei]
MSFSNNQGQNRLLHDKFHCRDLPHVIHHQQLIITFIRQMQGHVAPAFS